MATKLLMVLYTQWAPENSVLDIECHLHCDRMFPPHLMWWDCTGTALKFHLCWHSSIAVIEGGEQEKQVNGDEKPIRWFWIPQEMQHLAQKILLACPKTKGRSRRIKDSPRLRAESTGGLILPPASVTVNCNPSQPSEFIPEEWMRWVRNLSWKHWFPFLYISFCLPSHRLESCGLYSLFLD